jgi:glucosylglycerate synthase
LNANHRLLLACGGFTETKLADESFLTDDFVRKLINVGEVDILIGLPTHNNAKTIGSVVQTIQSGILKWFPRDRVVIINADGGSRDGTPDLVTGLSIDDVRRNPNVSALRTLHSISTRYGSTPANSVAFRTILSAAELLQAKACVLMSPESSITEGEWVSNLIRPIRYDGCDLVTPTFRRHKFEGLLITNLIYPMTRALYGLKIREPYTRDFGFSGGLASDFLLQNSWNEQLNGSGSGVELRLILSALAGHRRVCQAFLGEHEHLEHRAADLVPALRQTVGTLFATMDAAFPVWSAASGSQAVTTLGPDHELVMGPLRVNRKRLREMFSIGVAELKDVFQQILAPSTLSELQRIAAMEEPDFHAELWVRTVYEFAAAYQHSVINRDHIIQSLAPLFRGRALTFFTENRNASPEEVENNIEAICLEFERQKPSLLQMWKTRE